MSFHITNALINISTVRQYGKSDFYSLSFWESCIILICIAFSTLTGPKLL